MRKMTTLLAAAAVAAQTAMAQLPQAPVGANAAPPGSPVQPPLEPMAPSGAPPSITSPRIESSGSSGDAGMHSEAGVAETPPPSTPAARLKPQTSGDVTYLCGGVGEEEVGYMKREARHYDLQLTFAAKDGSYLADVNVAISDARGNPLLRTTCDAPLLLVDLPRSGTYRVHAEAAGYRLDRTARVEARRDKRAAPHVAGLVLVWPQQVADAAGGANAAAGSGGAGKGGGAGAAGR